MFNTMEMKMINLLLIIDAGKSPPSCRALLFIKLSGDGFF